MTLPLRTRVTAVFVAATALVLAALGIFVYVRTGSDLLDQVDAGLRSRADVLAGQIRTNGLDVSAIAARLIEPDEAFVQVADASGRILHSSSIVAGHTLLDPGAIVAVADGRAAFFDRRVPPIDDVTRILAVPVEHAGTRYVLMAGSSLQDRHDQLLQLGSTLAAAGVLGLALISFGGWMLVGAALRPVDRMRREAAAVSAAEPQRRLPVPPGDDELTALATTVNEMLERLHEAIEHERRFMDDASHELRTPLAVLRSRLELAVSGERSPADLRETLRRALWDAEHLSMLADDLFVLARSRDGGVPVHREDVDVAELAALAAAGHRPRAEAAGVRLRVEASGLARLDPLRFRQVLDNLLDNAVRHAGSDGTVRLSTSTTDGILRVVVEDSGPGIAPDVAERAFEPFARGAGEDPASGAGLGLAIVRAIAEAHGGGAALEPEPESAGRIEVTFRTA
ncbi:MAG: ATP-binding protein [Actinomycetota bacterium]